MLNLSCSIKTFKIKDINTGKYNTPLQTDYTIVSQRDYNLDGENPNRGVEYFLNNTELDFDEYKTLIDSGSVVQFDFLFANEISIESSFKNLTKKAKITLPRNLNFNGVKIASGDYPLFNIGDQILIELGYQYKSKNDGKLKNTKKELFRGYITKIDSNTPIVLECEDMMYYLKKTNVLYPDENFKKGETNEKITFQDLIKRTLSPTLNNKMNPDDTEFYFPNNNNEFNSLGKIQGDKIPVYINNINTFAFHFTTQRVTNIATMFEELKKKTGIVCYFDEFNNLHFEIPFQNTLSSSKKAVEIQWENQIISESLNFQREEDLNVRLELSSECVDKKQPKLYARNVGVKATPDSKNNYYGDEFGSILTVNLPPYNLVDKDSTQQLLDNLAPLIYSSQKYTGYAKGSTFTTFGEPAIFLGDKVHLTSKKYPERNGVFQVVGVNRTFGMSGYRQEVEIGVGVLDSITGTTK